MPDRPAEDGRALVGRLYDTYGASLYRYATLLLADAVAAEDAVHQVFTAILHRPPRLNQEAHYLRRAVRNECYSILRRRRADMASEGAFLEPAEANVNHDERLALERALRSLPPEQREVVHLHVYDGFTFQAIADAMYRRLKARAATEGRPAKALILRGVAQVLASKPAKPGRRIRLPIVRSKRPGSLRLDNVRIYDVISSPDINVWVALTHGSHVHHPIASDWFDSLEADVRFCFCRFTQLGLLRLLTAEAVMGDQVLNQVEAWAVYDQWITAGGAELLEEPPGLERPFQARTRGRHASPKAWADAYLVAFAEASQVTLVTFDRAFRGKVKPLILLEE